MTLDMLKVCYSFHLQPPNTYAVQFPISTLSHHKRISDMACYIGLQNWGSIELMLCRKSEVNGQLEVSITVLPQITPDKGCLSGAYQWARWTGLLTNKN